MPQPHVPRLSALCLALLGCGIAHAQTLPPVSVTVTRSEAAPFDVPASIDVVDGERLRGDGRAQLNLSEGLALVPGLLARDRQNQAQDLQLSVRGFGARSTFGVRGVRLYVDGIPATMPDGQGQLSHVDIGTASRVELLRGPFSALYGNSSGGVLQVFTTPGEGAPVVTPNIAFGSDGFSRFGLQASGASGPLGYTLGVSRFDTDGSRAHSAATRELANARLDWRLPDGRELMLVVNHLDARADDPLGLSRAQFDSMPQGADPAATLFNNRKTVRQTQLGLVYTQPLGGRNELRLMAYGGQRATVQYQSIPMSAQSNPLNPLTQLHPGGVIDLNRDYGGLDLRWTGHVRLAGRPLEVVAGLAYDKLSEHRIGRQNFIGTTLGVDGALRRDEINTVSNLDPYVQASLQLAPQWTVNAGLRRSQVRFASTDQYITGINGNDSGGARYGATLPAAGIGYAPSANLRFYAAAGKGFETPTFNEVAYRTGGGTGLNFGLRPSRSDNLEAGFKWRTPAGEGTRIEVNGSLFRTDTQDEIVTQSNSNGRATFQNAGATRRQGIELSAAWHLPRSMLVQLAYSGIDARYRDAFASGINQVPAGNRIPGIARSSLALEAGWRPARGWRGGVELRHLGKVPVNDLNSDAAEAFVTAAAHIGYLADLGRWKLTTSMRIDNVFDKKYAGSVIVNEGNGRFFESAAGRSWLLSLSGSYAF